MPDFEFPDATGVFVRSVELPLHGPFLITLQRRSSCPFHSLALRALPERNREIRAGGVTLERDFIPDSRSHVDV